VGAGEMLGRKTARGQKGEGKRIAQGKCGGGACGGSEPERTGFGIDARIEVHVGRLCERRFLVAGERDHEPALAFDQGNDAVQLRAFAGIRKRDQEWRG